MSKRSTHLRLGRMNGVDEEALVEATVVARLARCSSSFFTISSSSFSEDDALRFIGCRVSHGSCRLSFCQFWLSLISIHRHSGRSARTNRPGRLSPVSEEFCVLKDELRTT